MPPTCEATLPGLREFKLEAVRLRGMNRETINARLRECVCVVHCSLSWHAPDERGKNLINACLASQSDRTLLYPRLSQSFFLRSQVVGHPTIAICI